MASLQVGMGVASQKPVWRMPGAWEAGRLGTHFLGTTAKPLPSPQRKQKKQAGTLSCICNNSNSSIHVAHPNAHGTFALKDHYPMLMIPINKGEEGEEEETEWRLYSLPDKRLLDFQIPIPTDTYTNYCRGSTQYGWLVFVDDSDAVRLLNPFSLQEIQLPPLDTFPFPADQDDFHEIEWAYNPGKAVLSSNPSSTLDFQVLAIFKMRRVAFYISGGDKVWTLLEHPDGLPEFGRFRSFEDVIFYNQKFYAVDSDGKVMACDISDPHPSLTIVASPPPPGDANRRYLVESLGDLLQVERIAAPFTFWDTQSGAYEVAMRTCCFRAYKLDSTEGKWMEVNSLEDCSLFLGKNTSLSLSASDFPGCKPNCTYFTDSSDVPSVLYEEQTNFYDLGGSFDFELGIFNLEDGTIEPLLFPRRDSLSVLVIPPPVWVLPPETLE